MKLADKCRLFDSLRAASEISKQARQKKRSSKRKLEDKEEDPDDPSYGAVFGSCLTQEANVILARIQNSALRFVYNLKKFDHISPYRKRANLRSVQDICRLQTVTLVHKVLVTGEPSYLRRKLVARATLRERHTRQDDKLQLPRVRLEATKRSFSYFGPQEYNALPPVIKTLSVKTV
ncbi:hypothetical protein J6590_048282 [Homalodisca vitripennis]|nr:hypothetical protein J6590_048282 [Homalodisca vitripennis]